MPLNASAVEIKAAYHRALLQFHPDKNSKDVPRRPGSDSIDIASIKEAYRTLSTPELRARYDSQVVSSRSNHGPRPAQFVSLEEFEDEGEDPDAWHYECRCGGGYRITGDEMEQGHHLIACSSCSEVIWVGYEEVVDDEAGELKQGFEVILSTATAFDPPAREAP